MARVHVRYVSQYNIKAVRFSPFVGEQLLTCGCESIRVWRAREGKLRGVSVGTREAYREWLRDAGPGRVARLEPTVFTDIAFEHGLGVEHMRAKYALVASHAGDIYQVNVAR